MTEMKNRAGKLVGEDHFVPGGANRRPAHPSDVPVQHPANRSTVAESEESSASDWRVDLLSAFPELFSSMVGPGVAAGAGPSIECGPGWQDVIFRCCTRIDDALADRESFRFAEIAERQGVLRLYWGGWLSARSESEVRLAIDLAEARSQCVCEICGERGRFYRHENAFNVRCSAHAHGKPVPVKPGFEDMHLRQKTVIGRVRAAVCSFYDFERDAFVDIGPSEL